MQDVIVGFSFDVIHALYICIILKYYGKLANRNAITLVCYLAHTKTVIWR